MSVEIGDALVHQSQLSTGVILIAAQRASEEALNVIVDPATLTFAQGDNGLYRMHLQVVTAVFDGKGKYLGLRTDEYNVDYKLEGVRKVLAEGFTCRVPFNHYDGAKRVRLAVRDFPSDRIGTVDVEVTAAAKALHPNSGQ